MCAQLRPLDARMWCAMGQCYEHEQLGMDEAAIRCYQRAQGSGDREGNPPLRPFALHDTARFWLRDSIIIDTLIALFTSSFLIINGQESHIKPTKSDACGGWTAALDDVLTIRK
jgi:hypothetical protein